MVGFMVRFRRQVFLKHTFEIVMTRTLIDIQIPTQALLIVRRAGWFNFVASKSAGQAMHG